jgi:dienelactone hydrolase
LDIVLEDRSLKQHADICKRVVSFHGGLGRDASRPTEPITTKVLICHGANDPYVSKKKLPLSSKKCDTNADWQMIYYANAVHGFTNPEYGNDNSKVLLTMKKSCQTLF